MIIAHIHICLRCEHKAKDCNGPCPCLLDSKDIVWHASGNGCPQNRFDGSAHIQDPSRASDAEIEARKNLCSNCEHFRGLSQKLMVIRVECGACTTCEGGRSLTAAGQGCPTGKW